MKDPMPPPPSALPVPFKLLSPPPSALPVPFKLLSPPPSALPVPFTLPPPPPPPPTPEDLLTLPVLTRQYRVRRLVWLRSIL